MDKLILHIQFDSTEKQPDADLLARYSHDMIDSLEKSFVPEYIKSINSGMEESKMSEMYDIIFENLPLFLSEEDYPKMDSLIQRQNVSKTIENAYKTLVSPIGLGAKKYLKKERENSLPKGMKFWSFDCKLGQSEETATVVPQLELMSSIDEMVENKITTIYVEMTAKAVAALDDKG